MTDHDLNALARGARRKRRLPPDAACDTCGTTRHLSVRPDGRVLCYACLQLGNGRGAVEEDHLAGRLNLGGVVVRLRANDHRTVTELRTQLGIDAWPAPGGDPLLAVAHLLAGVATLLWLFAEWLVEVAGHAAERLGPGGWDGVRAAPVVP